MPGQLGDEHAAVVAHRARDRCARRSRGASAPPRRACRPCGRRRSRRRRAAMTRACGWPARRRSARRRAARAGSARGMHSSPILSIRFGMIDTRFALPQRSPKPLMVPWTCSTPSGTAARVLATAHSRVVVDVDAERGSARRCFTSRMISTISRGSVPPLVSQSTRQSRAGRLGRPQRRQRVLAVALEAVEEVLGVVDDLVAVLAEVGDRVADHARGSRRSVVPSASVTWKSQDLPTMVTTGVPASSRACRLGSASAADAGPPGRAEGGELGVLERRRPARAGRTAGPWGWSRASRPRCSGRRGRRAGWAMRTLSSMEKDTPSPWVPSRSVVS